MAAHQQPAMDEGMQHVNNHTGHVHPPARQHKLGRPAFTERVK